MKNIINFCSPFQNNNSVAKVGRNLLKYLNDVNYPFGISDLSLFFDNMPLEKNINLLKLINRKSNIISNKNILHGDVNFIIKNIKNDIPYFSLNVNRIPKKYVKALPECGPVLVYNEFSRLSLMGSGVKDELIHIVPPSINVDLYKKKSSLKINGMKSFAFLSTIDCSKNSDWLQMVAAFYDVFNYEDDVCLVLKINNKEYSEFYQNNIAREILLEKNKYNKKLPNIIVLLDPLTDDEMSSLYSSCHCYVKIHNVYSGLGFIEAFASGLICIGPETGGAREILNKNTGFIVNKKGERKISNESDFDGITYDIFDNEHLRENMRWVFDKYDNLKEKTDKERKLILSKFDSRVVGQTFLKFLR